jgi:hypothetical protein
MPGGDGTGPLGQGPMTGRGMGTCTPANVPATGRRFSGFGRGFGCGRGRGFGRGMGRGFGFWRAQPVASEPFVNMLRLIVSM